MDGLAQGGAQNVPKNSSTTLQPHSVSLKGRGEMKSSQAPREEKLGVLVSLLLLQQIATNLGV